MSDPDRRIPGNSDIFCLTCCVTSASHSPSLGLTVTCICFILDIHPRTRLLLITIWFVFLDKAVHSSATPFKTSQPRPTTQDPLKVHASRQNQGGSKRLSGWQGWGREEGWRSIADFRAVTLFWRILLQWMCVIVCLSGLTEGTSRVDLHVNRGLRVSMVCQWQLMIVTCARLCWGMSVVGKTLHAGKSGSIQGLSALYTDGLPGNVYLL